MGLPNFSGPHVPVWFFSGLPWLFFGPPFALFRASQWFATTPPLVLNEASLEKFSGQRPDGRRRRNSLKIIGKQMMFIVLGRKQLKILYFSMFFAFGANVACYLPCLLVYWVAGGPHRTKKYRRRTGQKNSTGQKINPGHRSWPVENCFSRPPHWRKK